MYIKYYVDFYVEMIFGMIFGSNLYSCFSYELLELVMYVSLFFKIEYVLENVCKINYYKNFL